MPHPTPQPKAGRQVERIREILVGRQMESIEQRLERLERRLQPMPVDSTSAAPAADFLEKVKKEQAEQLCRLRDEIDADRLRQLDETRRLAQQIQSVARARSSSDGETRQEAEQRLSAWFSQWQNNLYDYLNQREEHLISELRAELDRMRDWIRNEVAEKSSDTQADNPALRNALEQLSAATRAITESLGPSSKP
ncbi:MAG: hypothetical protein AAGI48_02005 [Verrucomicrobiota bacterium]